MVKQRFENFIKKKKRKKKTNLSQDDKSDDIFTYWQNGEKCLATVNKINLISPLFFIIKL